MSQKMSDEERRQFLSEGTRTLKLATIGADGLPHIVPVWFVLDGDTLVFTAGEDSVKVRNIARNPGVAALVDDENPPFAFVQIRGTVEATRNAPDLLEWTTKIARRYMGEAQAEAYGKRNAVDEELLIRLTPTKTIALKGISDLPDSIVHGENGGA